ncbi:acyl-CoA dehydrogenase family protein [Mycobacterium syngnathidarum]
MEFELSQDQRSLQSVVRGALSTQFDGEARRRYVDGQGEVDASSAWLKSAADMGLLGLLVPEEFGGSGATYVEAAIVLEELGSRLVPWPFLSTAVMAPVLLDVLGDAETNTRMLPGLAAGDVLAAVVTSRNGIVHGAQSDSVEGWELSGSVERVIDADMADVLLVQTTGASTTQIHVVEVDSPGVAIEFTPGLDLTRRLSTVTFDHVPSRLLGEADAAEKALAYLETVATVLLASEQVGAMRAAADLMLEYAKVREQFGRPIGSFQAIKHKCANAFVDTETTRTLVLNAAWRLANPDFPARSGSLRTLGNAVGAYASTALHRVAGENIQVHGAIGFTWEHDAHLYFRRAQSSSRILRSVAEQVDEAARAILSTPPTPVGATFRSE